MLRFLDWFFIIFHTGFTLFNMTGWIWRATRRIHAITIILTAFSWFFLGIWYGWGYCFCTDWHWQVREALRRPIRSNSYIHFLIMELTGYDAPPMLVDAATLVVFILCAILSFALNGRDIIKEKKAARRSCL